MNKKDISKKENGSVTLFVLVAMMFFLTVGVSLYITNENAHRAQLKNIKKIEQQYNDTQNKDELYQEQKEKLT